MSKNKHNNEQEDASQASKPAPAEDAAAQPASETTELKKENEKLNAQLDDMTDTLQHLQAEFENYRKRCDRDNASFALHANESLVKSLLPVLDNFELALLSSKEGDSKSEFQKGIELIYTQLHDTLENAGLKHISCCEKKFDPAVHEALLVEESDKEPNTVLEELQKGYLFHDRVIRHAKVKIAKRKPN